MRKISLKLLFIFMILLMTMPVALRAETVDVMAIGEGANRKEAITDALREAISKVTGVRIDSKTIANSAMQSFNSDTKSETSLNESQQSEIKKRSGGFIVKWQELSVENTDGKTRAKVSASVEVIKPLGNNPNSRRSIAVQPFSEGDSTAYELGENLQKQLVGSLTQTRRFTVLDPLADAKVREELQRLEEDELAINSAAKIAQAVTTDYILSGTVRGISQQLVNKTIALTGEKVNRYDASGEFSFSVVDIATRQVKWAGTEIVFASDKSNAATAKTKLLMLAAQTITASLTQNIYPLRLLNGDDPQNLVIGQGGNSLKQGDRLELFSLGEMMVDPYTKESLGRRETKIGVVIVTRVTAKLSYGKLDNSNNQQATAFFDPDMVLRPITANAAPNQSNQGEGAMIKLPGDK